MTQVISFTDYTPSPRYDDVPWTQVLVEEATTSSGPWTLIDTITLSPTDPDPSQPQTRNITVDNASDTPDLWYRLTFADGVGGMGQPSQPIQNIDPDTGSFASIDDFATRLGVPLTPADRDRASMLLADASDIIREEVKRGALNLVTDETITMRGTSDETIELPSTPVISVSSVTLDSEPLVEGHDWYLDGNLICRLPVTRDVILDGISDEMAAFPLGTAGFGWPEQTLQITYTHGYTEIPGKVKTICLEMVVRVWVNPGSVARATIGDTATVYDNMRFSPTGMQLTDDERKALKRLFGSTVKSVTIGR